MKIFLTGKNATNYEEYPKITELTIRANIFNNRVNLGDKRAEFRDKRVNL